MTAATVAALVAVGVSTSAHRRDEYLQAARIAIDPDRVRIELDLTPGISVADDVLREIDRDHDGSISAAEEQAYVARVAGAVAIAVDGAPLGARVTRSAFPPVAAIRLGEGVMQLELAAPLGVRPGAHRLQFRNAHRPDIGAYLANALVPASDRVAVTNQGRDYNQRTLDVDYVLRDKPRTWWDLIFQQKGTL